MSTILSILFICVTIILLFMWIARPFLIEESFNEKFHDHLGMEALQILRKSNDVIISFIPNENTADFNKWSKIIKNNSTKGAINIYLEKYDDERQENDPKAFVLIMTGSHFYLKYEDKTIQLKDELKMEASKELTKEMPWDIENHNFINIVNRRIALHIFLLKFKTELPNIVTTLAILLFAISYPGTGFSRVVSVNNLIIYGGMFSCAYTLIAMLTHSPSDEDNKNTAITYNTKNINDLAREIIIRKQNGKNYDFTAPSILLLTIIVLFSLHLLYGFYQTLSTNTTNQALSTNTTNQNIESKTK